MEIFDRNNKPFYLSVVFLSLFLTHGSFALQSQNEEFELKDINQIKDIGSLDVSKDADLLPIQYRALIRRTMSMLPISGCSILKKIEIN